MDKTMPDKMRIALFSGLSKLKGLKFEDAMVGFTQYEGIDTIALSASFTDSNGDVKEETLFFLDIKIAEKIYKKYEEMGKSGIEDEPKAQRPKAA